jgi:hypothetical protein
MPCPPHPPGLVHSNYTWRRVNVTKFSRLTKLRCIRSRDSAVDIATRYGLDDRGVGVRVLVGSRIFYSSHCPDLL